MILDAALQFTGSAGTPGSTDSPTTGTQTSTNTIDLGVQEDLGIGDNSAVKLSCTVIAAFTGGTSLQVNIQGSADNSAWTTMAFGPVIAEAALTVGTHLCDLDLPRPAGALVDKPGATQARPRYIRLQYVSAGTHGAGSLFAGLLLDRADHITTGYPSAGGVVTVPN
jgi:hypothetical protein